MKDRKLKQFATFTLDGSVDGHWMWFLKGRREEEPVSPSPKFWTITRTLDEDGVYRGSAVAKGYHYVLRKTKSLQQRS